MATKQKAIEVMRVWEGAEKQYGEVNEILRGLNPDFPHRVDPIDNGLGIALLSLLDEVLGDGIASYYLCECSLMKDGGRIVDNGREWPIKTLEDVLAYSERAT